jgi:hypothetical protein
MYDTAGPLTGPQCSPVKPKGSRASNVTRSEVKNPVSYGSEAALARHSAARAAFPHCS